MGLHGLMKDARIQSGIISILRWTALRTQLSGIDLSLMIM